MKHLTLMRNVFGVLALLGSCAHAQVTLLPPQEAVPAPAIKTSVVADDHLNPLHQEEWVILDSAGAVHGQFVQLADDGLPRPIANAKLMLSKNSVVLAHSQADANGRFGFSGLQVGTYGLVARSADSMAAFALHVLPFGASARLDSDFTVYGTSLPGQKVNEILRAHSVPGGSAATYPDYRNDPVGDARAFSNSKIRMTEGGFAGRISRAAGLGYDLSGNVVHVYRRGQLVARQVSDASGRFSVKDLGPGVYDFVVSGKDGIAAGSFELVVGGGQAQLKSKAGMFVSAPQDVAESLNVELIPSQDYYVQEEEVASVPIIEESGFVPMAGGGFVGPSGFPGGGGGGFGGGGGGGFGGGGIGGLLGIGGLAAGVAALAANDDGFTTPPASVIIP